MIKISITSELLDDIKIETKSRLQAIIKFGAVGVSATPSPSALDTTLGNEVFRDAIDEFDTSVSNKITSSLKVLSTEANGNNLQETGTFEESTNGDMWTRNTFTPINKTSDIQVFFDTTITISVTEDT